MLALLWKYRKPFTVVLLVALAVSIALLHRKDEDEYNLVERGLVKVAGPIQWAFDVVLDGVSEGWHRYIDNRDAASDNARLRLELATARRKLQQVDEVWRENHRLLSLLGLGDRSREISYVPARVIARSSSPFFRSLRINRGAKDGVVRGMGVVADVGLVGRVMAVEQGYSDVMLIADTSSTVDVYVGRTRARGRLRGLGDRNLRARIDYLVRSANVEVGDEVYTTGAGVVFPKGMLAGHVASVRRVEHGLYQEAIVEPAAPLQALDEVMLVYAFGPEALVEPPPAPAWVMPSVVGPVSQPASAPSEEPASLPGPGEYDPLLDPEWP